MSIEFLVREHPQRSFALKTTTHILNLTHLDGPTNKAEFIPLAKADLDNYRGHTRIFGTLGLIAINKDAFLCVVTRVSAPITIRPGETVRRIEAVDFRMYSEQENGIRAVFLTGE